MGSDLVAVARPVPFRRPPNPQWSRALRHNSIPEPTAEQKDQNPQDSPARISPQGTGGSGDGTRV